jgi:predicted SAM-dependent methyltransferase
MIRINLGSGRHFFPNAINIDHDESADIVGPVDKLPDFEDESVDEIYAIHLFEHLERLEVGKILNEWSRVLKKGGKLVLELPCLDKIARMVVEGEERPQMVGFGIFGDIREPSKYMRHLWCYTQKELCEVLKKSGFEPEVVEPIYHVSKRDMRVIGVKQ